MKKIGQKTLHIWLEQEINLLQIPHPSKARRFKFPLPRHDAQSNARGLPGGGDVEASV